MRKFVYIGRFNNLPYCVFEDPENVWHLAYWNDPTKQWIYLDQLEEEKLPGLIARAIPDQEAEEKYHSKNVGMRDNWGR